MTAIHRAPRRLPPTLGELGRGHLETGAEDGAGRNGINDSVASDFS